MRYSTISAIGAFTALSAASADYLHLVPSRCSGGADASVRITVEDAPGADGTLIFPAFDGAQVILLGGDFVIKSDGADPGYFSAQDTVFASLKAALDTLKSAPGDLVHSGGTLKVWKHDPLDTTWDDNAKILSVTFGLIVDQFA